MFSNKSVDAGGSGEPVTFARVAARKGAAEAPPPPPPDSNAVELPVATARAFPPAAARPAGSESYAEAVKTARNVWLGGVPVNPAKLHAHEQRTNTTTSGMESVTNSTMHEQESVLSSWADDDQCFFDSIRLGSDRLAASLDRGSGLRAEATAAPASTAGSGFRRGRGGRRWRIIPGGESGGSGSNSGSGNGKQQQQRRRNTNGGPAGAARRGSGAEQSNLSGGRFDALADVAIRRHL